MPAGVKMMPNSGKWAHRNKTCFRIILTSTVGEFYGPNGSPANLELLSRFFKKYSDYAHKTFLSVKVGLVSVLSQNPSLIVSSWAATSREE